MAYVTQLKVPTGGRGFIDVTRQIDGAVHASGVEDGLVNVFIRHTSASLVVQENADPDVRIDLERFFSDLAPDGDPRYRHTDEGPDDMPGHVRAVLTLTSLTVPVRAGRLSLGTWQAIYLWEHRHADHRRVLDITVL